MVQVEKEAFFVGRKFYAYKDDRTFEHACFYDTTLFLTVNYSSTCKRSCLEKQEKVLKKTTTVHTGWNKQMQYVNIKCLPPF
jgi:hypothetical protein